MNNLSARQVDRKNQLTVDRDLNSIKTTIENNKDDDDDDDDEMAPYKPQQLSSRRNKSKYI